MIIPTIEELFEIKAHLGHKKEYSDPRFRKYLFVLREGTFIIDLEKTQEELKKALGFLSKISQEGKVVLFIGTKKQAKKITEEIAKKYSIPYVTHRWLGGTLTNFDTILKNIKSLENLEEKVNSEEFTKLSKKEQTMIKKELERFKKSFEGLRTLKKIPDCLFIVDAAYENIAVTEANKLDIPIVAICDSNSNPAKIAWSIPANDEAEKSVELIVKLIGEAINEGGKQSKNKKLKKIILSGANNGH